MILAGLAVLFATGAGLAVSDYICSQKELGGGITRNDYGKGARTETLHIEVGDEPVKEDLEVTVSERMYSSAQMQELFRRAIQKMDGWILGENESLDRVETDLNLITEIPGEPIDVSWELDRYDVMNVYGELNEEELEDEGTMVTLKATLTYRERQTDQALYECVAMIYPRTLTGKGQTAKRVQEETEKADEQTRTQKLLTLPGEVDGKEVRFYKPMDTRGVVIMVMACLILFLFYAMEKQNEGKELEKKRSQMTLDYPEIVSKLTLLLGAGMTVKRAWKKIAEDYSAKKGKSVRYAYEEMCVTCHEMDSGMAESESYERFGRRCGTQEYLKLGALLSQNLRKGTKGLGDMLRAEARQAFEDRKARAKRLGEEAGTKLLMPMFLMLAIVLIIVIVPAFLSVQM